MERTEGRYPIINPERAVGMIWGIWELKDRIDFLKGFDPKKEIGYVVLPGERLTHRQCQLYLGRAAKTVYATMQMGGTEEEIERAIKFAFVMTDAEKYCLDVNEAMEKYGFKELEDKYVRGVKSE